MHSNGCSLFYYLAWVAIVASRLVEIMLLTPILVSMAFINLAQLINPITSVYHICLIAILAKISLLQTLFLLSEVLLTHKKIPSFWQGHGNLATRLLHKVVTRLLVPVYNLVTTLDLKLFPPGDNLVTTFSNIVAQKFKFKSVVQCRYIT